MIKLLKKNVSGKLFWDTAKSVLKDSIHSAFWQYDVPVAQPFSKIQ
ncbi:hypothetical protein MVI27_07760 [Chryseobacterium salipaludis]|nr:MULTISPECIES: hypothetical protein [Chryseobacterium]MCJ8498153.1 hypothetical protein [Chryseobacterium salipaludis]MCX3297598.1 hypothetical protein [Planobacterium sp. JC490]